MVLPEVSEYEKQRLENIRRNQEELTFLGLNDAKRKLINVGGAKASSARVRNLRVKRIKNERKPKVKRSVPLRRSKRQQGLDSDGKHLSSNFKSLPISGKAEEIEREVERSIQGNVEIDEDGKTFLESLKMQIKCEKRTEISKKCIESDIIRYAERLSSLSVDIDSGVRKLTPERIYGMDVSSSASHVIVSVGDKVGNFALWNNSLKNSDASIFTARPHRKTLSTVLFDNSDFCKVLTAAYDGRITQLDSNKMVFTELYSCDEALFDVVEDKRNHSFLVAREDGMVVQLDTRGKYEAVNEWQLHEKKVNTIAICPDQEYYLSTASLDRMMCIWDLRKMKKPLHALPHALSINQSSWSPDGKHLATVCMDNYIRVYDAPHLCANPAKVNNSADIVPENPLYKAHHDNRTGRWLTKFKVDWDQKQPNALVIGSMDQPRCVEVFSASCDRLMRLRTDAVGSVQSLNKFHPSLDVIISANSSGRVHVWSS